MWQRPIKGVILSSSQARAGVIGHMNSNRLLESGSGSGMVSSIQIISLDESYTYSNTSVEFWLCSVITKYPLFYRTRPVHRDLRRSRITNQTIALLEYEVVHVRGT